MPHKPIAPSAAPQSFCMIIPSAFYYLQGCNNKSVIDIITDFQNLAKNNNVDIKDLKITINNSYYDKSINVYAVKKTEVTEELKAKFKKDQLKYERLCEKYNEEVIDYKKQMELYKEFKKELRDTQSTLIDIVKSKKQQLATKYTIKATKLKENSTKIEDTIVSIKKESESK